MKRSADGGSAAASGGAGTNAGADAGDDEHSAKGGTAEHGGGTKRVNLVKTTDDEAGRGEGREGREARGAGARDGVEHGSTSRGEPGDGSGAGGDGTPGGDGLDHEAADLSGTGVTDPESDTPVPTHEPLLAARVHRPADLMRFLTGILAVAAIFVLIGFAHNTTSGLEDDILSATDRIPRFLISFVGLASSAAVLVVPLAFAVERLIKRDGLRVADGVLAAVLAHGLSLGIDLWVAKAAPESITLALATVTPGSTTLTDPVHGYLAPVIAYMTAVGMQSRPRWRIALWVVVALDALAEIIGGYTTPLSVAVTIGLGLSVAYGTLYAVGAPNVRPTTEHLLTGLRKVGFTPHTAHRATDGPENTHRYLVVQEDDRPPLDVHVIDREQLASGFFYRLWSRLRLRGAAAHAGPRTLRAALEQEALISYAATSAGAATPRLIATSELGPDAVILVYEQIGGRSLTALHAEEVADRAMATAWRAVSCLHARRIAHRRLTADSLLVTEHEVTCLLNLAGGEIAASDLLMRMDIAQLLTTFGLRVGPERAVDLAVEILGAERTADCLALLQPVALSRETRAELRHYNRERRAAADAEHTEQLKAGELSAEELNELPPTDLLSGLRERILAKVPQAPVEPVKLERLKPKTLITVIAAAFAMYFLIGQLTSHPPTELIAHANWGWAAVAVACAVASYGAATMQLTGFVPEKLSYQKTLLAQVAGSFVKLVAPAAVGGVALNTRYLQRSGVRPGQAVASVGASQLVGAVVHLLLLLGFGFVAGTQSTKDVTPSRTVIAGVLVVAVLVMVAAAIPPVRRWVLERLQSLFAGVIPRMLDLLQRPSKLVEGVGGSVLITLTLAANLYFSLLAFDGHLSFAAVVAVYLAGNAAGSAVPTPGGVGAIEVALSAGLTAAGMPYSTALTGVLLHRALTYWLPVLPGWGAFAYLQRKGLL
nr:lysylphosphatidylglycerol synthase transmembrane domain-containing protein [Phaeacidiphilus oryzae]